MIVRQLLQWDSESGNLQRFGFEYGNIAESLIVQGRFADSMTAGSGPTAWMPPLLCWIYALAFAFGGGRTFLTAIVLVNLKALATTACLWHFLALVWQRWKWTGMLVSLILCQLWVECDHHRVFGEFDDTWWVNSLTFLALMQLLRPNPSWCAPGTSPTVDVPSLAFWPCAPWLRRAGRRATIWRWAECTRSRAICGLTFWKPMPGMTTAC